MLLALFGFGNSATIAKADCTISGTVATCTGDVSDGVSETSTSVETLNVDSLTSNIQPDSGTSGTSLLGVGGTGDDGTDFFGGNADDGGSGGPVEINYDGGIYSLTTTGDDAEGIIGRSSGGNGGEGGEADYGTIVVVSVGGDGGNGANGSAVSISSNGQITTTGANSYGILAIGQGGDGGAGGKGLGGGGLGGDGGDGGSPGIVYVDSTSLIETTGEGAQGILAQSLGGSGGDGGEGDGAVSSAGDAGQSKAGQSVTVINQGDISTGGSLANGVLIQSLGGFGGDGGDAGGLFYASGSSGVEGAAGGIVSLTNGGDISTTGPTAYGLLAQSVGGGGGSGGNAGAISSVGGDGAGGGAGGAVTVVNTGTVTTTGTVSLGILAQSVGGGGGDGGSAGGLVAIGGSGSAAADGSTVHMTNENTVSTLEDGALGILVQSVGGGGGHGGESGALVSIGGQAGGGGDADDVTFVNTGDVSTEGDRADAIQIQSVGGGGGKGGSAAAAGLTLSIAVGGAGGDGGDASDVYVNTDNTAASETAILSTQGDHSAGLATTSIGGGGGSGGWAISASVGGFDISVALGGTGGSGGNAGAVDTKFNGTIATVGDHSAGLSATSTGGGGGAGGFAVDVAASVSGSIGVGVGGDGGGGGYGDTVDLTSWATITTEGDHSPGIIGSSIGGGGGNGGFTVSAAASSTASLSVGVGGGGATAGDGSAVTVDATGNISTGGDFSYGLAAQSLGGGGGNGGFSVDAAASAGVGGSIAIGGSGSGGGDAANVSATNVGSITTEGDHSHGLLAQSLGGGGGAGGFVISGSVGSAAVSVGVGGTGSGGGSAGSVIAESSGAVSTNGEHAHGLFAQSLGGGGGNGGYSISGSASMALSVPVSIGGQGGSAGDGSTVDLTNTGAITTTGGFANAIFAQSQGGGGGNGGYSVAGALTFSPEAAGLSIAVSIGGLGGGGGVGDEVTVISEGDLQTSGQNAIGIFAQSLGGGGGNGGASVEGTLNVSAEGSWTAGVTLAGDGGTGSHGSAVVVQSTGSISTDGDNAAAIFAQSVGGGGGNGGFSVGADLDASGGDGGNLSLSIGGEGGSGNDGSTVIVTSIGNLTTLGDNSSALQAQSIGGGGGNGGFSIAGTVGNVTAVDVSIARAGGDGGIGGNVDADSTGIIQTSGNQSYGILAQSIGGAGGNGGFSVAGSLSTSSNVNVSISGEGGDGAAAGTAEVTQKGGYILTTGSGAHGIFAQSLGGGGGNGGFSVEGAVTLSPESSLSAGVSVAGGGGDGATSSEVTVTNIGGVQTEGDNASGIFAQSLGGGGGSGGFSVTGNLSISASSDATIGVSVAGTGGTGSYGSEVDVTSTGNVITTGENATAILAQSIGGGGGNGGFSITGNIAVSSDDGAAGGVSVGGTGGSGSDGAVVTLVSIGGLSTTGNNSSGILAQSVGGGGGNGGFSGAFDASKQAALSVSIGGGAGDGGTSDEVDVSSAGTIITQGSLSYGVLAQSVGGSGGNGGFSLSGSFSTKASVSVSVGGGAGTGGTASAVTLVQTGSVATTGSGSHGLFAQSVGGGGGTGGFSGAASITYKGTADLGVSVGGSGGTGGTAGAVSLTSSDGTVIRTEGDGAYGLLAQSIGGGGGDGGFSFVANLGFVNSDSSTTNIGVAIGGDGGAGGTASTVDLNNATAVVTLGDDSYGILAQSIGGGGGSGGLAISGSVNLSTDASNNLNVAIGGAGLTGNTADKVTVQNDGSVTTLGDRSRGIFAQSVGGGGGTGGLAFSGTLAGGGDDATAKAIEVSVGGDGGSGANAGEVELTNTGDIITSGDLAEGILAQSVGGGGGAGGLAGTGVLSYEGGGTNLKVSVAVGGTGGVGGTGEDVSVRNSGSVTGTGVGSTAIYAQSVGGGGGNGGSSFVGVIDLTTPGGGGEDSDEDSNDRSLTVNVAIGGDAGDGANAGTVSVVNSGALVTTAGSAKGIFAQSVGGGGGSGGASDAFSMEIGSCSNPAIPGCETPDFTDKSLTVEVAIGGSGGEGGHGEAVSVTNENTIQTSGDGSEAIYAQSVGAGGGEGGNGTLGQDLIDGVPGDVIGTVDTVLNPPFAFWQEIGVTVGGTGGAAGSGGTVTVDNDNTLITTGDRSSAIFAQSVGGGGGHGGNTEGVFVGVSIGGSAGAAGDGDTVDVTNDGNIRTDGIASIGIFAQSVGGGGGVSGSVEQDFFGTGADLGIGVGLSAGGGDGGNGGDVTVATSSIIVTSGDGAHGVFAQSVGGGGGLAGSSSSDIGINFAGTNGDDGDAGDVIVNHTGYIYTTGAGTAGIFAQSASGGADGNTGDSSDDYASGAVGIGGNVSVSVNSAVIASGENSIGIFAQSVGLNGDGQILIDIGETSVISGGAVADDADDDEEPIGILVLDGSGNHITIDGTVTTAAGVDGTAIETRQTASNADTDLDDLSDSNANVFLAVEHSGTTITNNGTLIGSIFLAEADNQFINTDTYVAGETIDLGGTDNQFINDGILSPGGEDNITTTTLDGSYLQTENGQILADVNFADNDAGVNTSDLIEITGDAIVNGTIILNSINGAFVEPDETGEVTIISSAADFGTPTIVAQDTEVVDYELRTDADGNVFLAWNVDFSPSAGDFNANQTAVADYLVETIATGEPNELTDVLNAVLEAPTAAVLANYYDQLSAEPYLQTEQAAVLSAQQFGRGLYECPEYALPVSDNGCGWLQVSGQKSSQSSEFENVGYNESVIEMQFGIGGSLSEQMDILFGISYEKSYLDTEELASSEGNRLQTGIGMSFANDSGTVFSIAAVGGYATTDVERYQTLTGAAVTARGNQKLYYGGGQARIQQTILFDDIFVAPEFGAWVGYVRHTQLNETGAGATNLQIDAGGNTYAALRPALTVGTEFRRSDGNAIRPFISGGASFALTKGGLSQTDLTASLQGDDNLAPAFTASRSLENPHYDVQLGLDWVSPAGVAFRVGGIAQFASNYRSYGGIMRLVAPF